MSCNTTILSGRNSGYNSLLPALEIPDMQSFFRAKSRLLQMCYPFEGAWTLAFRRQDNGEAGRLVCGDHGYSPPYA